MLKCIIFPLFLLHILWKVIQLWNFKIEFNLGFPLSNLRYVKWHGRRPVIYNIFHIFMYGGDSNPYVVKPDSPSTTTIIYLNFIHFIEYILHQKESKDMSILKAFSIWPNKSYLSMTWRIAIDIIGHKITYTHVC